MYPYTRHKSARALRGRWCISLHPIAPPGLLISGSCPYQVFQESISLSAAVRALSPCYPVLNAGCLATQAFSTPEARRSKPLAKPPAQTHEVENRSISETYKRAFPITYMWWESGLERTCHKPIIESSRRQNPRYSPAFEGRNIARSGGHKSRSQRLALSNSRRQGLSIAYTTAWRFSVVCRGFIPVRGQIAMRQLETPRFRGAPCRRPAGAPGRGLFGSGYDRTGGDHPGPARILT